MWEKIIKKNSINGVSNEHSIVIFVLLVTAYFFSYFFRVSASIVLPGVATELKISASLVGLISSMYFYAYAIMQFFGGALNDRFGSVIVVSYGIAVNGIGVLLFAFASSPAELIIGRLFMGLGLAPILSGVLVFQSRYFKKEKYTFLSSVTFAVGNLGAITSVAPLAIILSLWGRKYVFIGLALLNFLLSIMLLKMKKFDSIPEQKSINKGKMMLSILNQLKESLLKLKGSKQLKLMLILWGISFGSLMSLQGLWAVPWYGKLYGVTTKTASYWATLIGIGVMIGSLLAGQIGKDSKSRNKIIADVCYLNCFSWFLLLVSINFKMGLVVTGLMGFLIGLTSGVSYVHFTSEVNNNAGDDKGGALFGVMNMFTFLVAIVYQLGTGMLLEHFSKDNVNITEHAFFFTFTIIFITIALSLIAAKNLNLVKK